MYKQILRFTLLAAVLTMLAPAVARAQSMQLAASSDNFFTRNGAYFLVGGGVTGYFDKAVRDKIDTGGAWDLRVGVGNGHYLGGELAYVGSAQNARSLGDSMVSNGAEAVLRLQYPYHRQGLLVEPFAFGGAGWTHFDVQKSTRLVLNSSDDVFTIPVGAGLTVGYKRFLMDARFTYRQTFNEQLITKANGDHAGLESWAATLSAGYQF